MIPLKNRLFADDSQNNMYDCWRAPATDLLKTCAKRYEMVTAWLGLGNKNTWLRFGLK